MVLVGVQPRLTQVPPTDSLSISATLQPAFARVVARGPPLCPDPIIIASYVSAMVEVLLWVKI